MQVRISQLIEGWRRELHLCYFFALTLLFIGFGICDMENRIKEGLFNFHVTRLNYLPQIKDKKIKPLVKSSFCGRVVIWGLSLSECRTHFTVLPVLVQAKSYMDGSSGQLENRCSVLVGLWTGPYNAAVKFYTTSFGSCLQIHKHIPVRLMLCFVAYYQ